MDPWDYDVVIVGAGPVGGRAATLLSQDGLKVLMLDQTEVYPPSIGKQTPEIMAAASDNRNTIGPAQSDSLAQRCRGLVSKRLSLIHI